MLKMYTAFTARIDDPAAAVREIFEQLDIGKNMRKNAVGIVHFHRDFANDAVWSAISRALPFELAGCISSCVGSCGQYGDAALSVAMLTSDDVRFSVRTIDGVSSKTSAQLAGAAANVCGEFCTKGEFNQSGERPKLVLAFMPPLPHFSGDDFVDAVNALPDPLPFFGMIAFNMENAAAGPHIVAGGGAATPDMFSYVALYGNVSPKFHVTSSFVVDESFGRAAEITDADRATLKTVDGVPAVEFLKKLGMITANNTVAGYDIWTVPAILRYINGTKVVRAFLGIAEGTEYIVASGAMKTGATITFAYPDGEKTIASAEKLITDLSAKKENGFLAYSCAARSRSLGAKFFAEAQKVADCARDGDSGAALDYSLAYSGGEICPVFDNEGKLVNTLHNYTLVACSLG